MAIINGTIFTTNSYSAKLLDEPSWNIRWSCKVKTTCTICGHQTDDIVQRSASAFRRYEVLDCPGFNDIWSAYSSVAPHPRDLTYFLLSSILFILTRLPCGLPILKFFLKWISVAQLIRGKTKRGVVKTPHSNVTSAPHRGVGNRMTVSNLCFPDDSPS